MNIYTLESFISFCDDMMIAEEGLKDIGNCAIITIKKLIIKLKHLIKNLFYTLKKKSKFYIPKKVEPILLKELSDLFALKERLLKSLDNTDDMLNFINDPYNSIDSKNIRQIIDPMKQIEYSRIEFKMVNSNEMIKCLKAADVLVEKMEILQIEIERQSNDDIQSSTILCNYGLKLAQKTCDVLLMFFEWNGIYNKASNEYTLKHGGSATYDEPINY